MDIRFSHKDESAMPCEEDGSLDHGMVLYDINAKCIASVSHVYRRCSQCTLNIKQCCTLIHWQ